MASNKTRIQKISEINQVIEMVKAERDNRLIRGLRVKAHEDRILSLQNEKNCLALELYEKFGVTVE